jgi:hypothetical protein
MSAPLRTPWSTRATRSSRRPSRSAQLPVPEGHATVSVDDDGTLIEIAADGTRGPL